MLFLFLSLATSSAGGIAQAFAMQQCQINVWEVLSEVQSSKPFLTISFVRISECSFFLQTFRFQYFSRVRNLKVLNVKVEDKVCVNLFCVCHPFLKPPGNARLLQKAPIKVSCLSGDLDKKLKSYFYQTLLKKTTMWISIQKYKVISTRYYQREQLSVDLDKKNAKLFLPDTTRENNHWFVQILIMSVSDTYLHISTRYYQREQRKTKLLQRIEAAASQVNSVRWDDDDVILMIWQWWCNDMVI